MTLSITKRIVLAVHLISACSLLSLHPAACQATSNIPSGPTSARSSKVLALFQAAIDASGGNEFWSQVHAARIAGTMAIDSDGPTTSIVWTDEWSQDARMERKSAAVGSTPARRYTQDRISASSGSAVQPTQPGQAQFKRPRFDKATSLLMHLPAAALYAILQDNSYSVTDVPSPTGDDTSCGRIRKRTRASNVDITMCLSPATRLPVHAVIALANAFAPSRPLSELITYKSFHSVGQGVLPSAITVVNPGKRTIELTFDSPIWNPELPTETFSGGNK